jgi:hypothetical protein
MMKRASFFLLILFFFTLSSCGGRQAAEVTEAIQAPVTPPSGATAYPGCYFNWATQPLPDLSQRVQEVVDRKGIAGVTALAEAYGENCYDNLTNKVVYFSAMETDFRFKAAVEDLDKARLGESVERLLEVIEALPGSSIPGPRPGYVGISFQAGEKTVNIWFLLEDGKSALAKGLHGAALFEALKNK